MGTSISLLPTIVTGCSDSVPLLHETGIPNVPGLSKTIKSPSYFSHGGTLDILAFDDDRLQRLDSYQRIENFNGTAAHITSTSGDKIFFLCHSYGMNRFEWAEINSYNTLRKIHFDIENERKEYPTATGYCRCRDSEGTVSVNLKPLASKVMINSISINFNGTGYSGQNISEAKAYLTNVNAVCSMIPEVYPTGTRMINSGGLNHYDIIEYKDQSLVIDAFGELEDKSVIQPGSCFLCYANNNDKSRRTRLVIEGKIQGATYYWPIEVGQGEGIGRSVQYVYDIMISRKGSSDPESPIDPENVKFELNIQEWTEKENYQVLF